MPRSAPKRRRCAWCTGHPLYIAYHDEEWGVPLRDSRALFELLCLEGAQAGLSWWTILSKREAYRQAFAGFDPAKVARFTARDVTRLLGNAGIVRHRQKIEATVGNARAYLALAARGIDFSQFVWAHAPVGPRRPSNATSTAESTALSRNLKAAGFRFVGPVTCHAFMQASGMVDDHAVDCWRAGRRNPRGQ